MMIVMLICQCLLDISLVSRRLPWPAVSVYALEHFPCSLRETVLFVRNRHSSLLSLFSSHLLLLMLLLLRQFVLDSNSESVILNTE